MIWKAQKQKQTKTTPTPNGLHRHSTMASRQELQTQSQDRANNIDINLGDTQIIDTDGLRSQNSQAVQTLRIRMLNHSEENELVDSSCEFQDSVDTQEILRDDEPDTMIIETQHQKTQADFVDDSIIEKEEHTEAFNDFKVPAGDSPWINKIKDTLGGDSQTPWLKKISDPFSETPMNSKIRDPFDDTPTATNKLTNSFNTPTTKAHNLFQRLRENDARPELEVESQSAPMLTYDSPMLSIDQHEISTQDVRTGDESFSLHNLGSNGDVQVVREEQDATEDRIDDRSIVIGDDTAPIEFPGTRSTNNDDLDEQSQAADLQVLGTAPDNDCSVETDRDFYIESGAANITHISSPVVSEDEKDVAQKEIGIQQFMLEDSIQKHHRDLDNKTAQYNNGLVHTRTSLSIEDQPEVSIRTNSLPTVLTEEVGKSGYVTPGNNALRSQTMHTMNEIEVHLIKDPQNLEIESTKETKELEKSQVAEAEDGEGVYNVIGENVTQEFSDIDDESKLNNAIEGQLLTNEKRGSVIEEDEDEDEEEEEVLSPVIKRRRITRKRKPQSVSSYKTSKRSKTDDTNGYRSSESEVEVGLVGSSGNEETEDIGVNLKGREETKETERNTTPDSSEVPHDILREESHELTDDDILFRNSVWCQYNSQFYPGIVKSRSEKGFRVQFVASSEDIVGSIYPLDIRIGDQVKFDKKNYITTGFECLRPADDDIIRCIRGYDTLIVKRVKGRGKKRIIEDDELEIAIAEITLDNEEWHKRDRIGGDLIKQKRFTKEKDLSENLTYQEELLMSTPLQRPITSKIKSMIFDKCLFTGTNVEKDISDMIESNGGTLVEDGFSSLFTKTSVNGLITFKLDKDLSNYDFAAVISSTSLRSAKYLEGLALKWPLLSNLFISDCLAEKKFIKDFRPFVLTAGISMRVKGPLSIDLFDFVSNWRSGFSLHRQLSNNRILEGYHVFLASNSPDISAFIFFVLGAATIQTITFTNYSNLITALSKYDDGKTLIYGKSYAQLEASLDGLSSKKKTEKAGMITDMLTNKTKIDALLVDWEWVVQSLVEGSLNKFSKKRTFLC